MGQFKKQIYLKITLIFLICTGVWNGNVKAQASFTSIPAAVSGTINVCAGSTILFTNTTSSSSLNSPVVFNWNFGNGQSATSIGPHAITYANLGSFTVSLSINSNGQILNATNITVNVSSYTPSVSPTLVSGTSVTGNGCTQTYTSNGFPVFQTVGPITNGVANGCSCGTGPLLAIPNPGSYPSGSTGTIYWGANGSNQITNIGSSYYSGSTTLTSFPGQSTNFASHYTTTQTGNYNLMYVVNFPNGEVFSG